MIIYTKSKDNKYVKLARALRARKQREKHGLYLAEGVRIVREAAEYADIDFVIFSESLTQKDGALAEEISASSRYALAVPDGVFEGIANTDGSQGVLAAVRASGTSVDLSKARFVLILDGVSDPGNLGTIIRTAESMGADAVLLTNNCADLYGPKAVRATMGSIFRMPAVSCECGEMLAELKARGFSICASSLAAERTISEVGAAQKTALVVGNEAHGISAAVEESADTLFKIPMYGKAESLSVSIAAGIAMYELGAKARRAEITQKK